MRRQDTSNTMLSSEGGSGSFGQTSPRKKLGQIADKVKPKPVPVQEMFSTGPIEKWRRYRIFPFKLVCNVVILSLLLAYAFGYHVQRNAYDLNSRFGLASMFFDAADNSDTALSIELDTIDDFVEFIERVTIAYHHIPDDSVGVYMHYVYSVDDPRPIAPVLRLDFEDDASFRTTGTSHPRTLLFNLTQESPIGPFSNLSAYVSPDQESDCAPRRDDRDVLYLPCRNSTIGDFLDMLHFASIDLSLRGIRVDPTAHIASVVRWNIKFDFSLAYHRSLIKMKATFTPINTQHPSTMPLVLCLLLLPLALWDLILRVRSFHRYHIYMTRYLPYWMQTRAKKLARYHANQAGSSWTIFAIITDLITVAFCICTFVDGFLFFGSGPVRTAQTLLLGLASMFSSFLLISYLQTAPKFYVLMKSLGTAMPHLLLYFIGVLPVFLGFSICGTCVFGGFTSTFATLPNSMVTLFCVVNGDSLLEMFTTIDQTDFFPMRLFSRLFLMSFLGLFICNVLNIALAIVQDAYTHVKEVFEVCQFDAVKADEKLAGDDPSGTSENLKPPGEPSSPLQKGEANVCGGGKKKKPKPLSRNELMHMIERIQEALGPEDAVVFDHEQSTF